MSTTKRQNIALKISLILGTKQGSIQIFDLDKAEMTEEINDAHTKEIWSMCLYSDKKGFVTASADQTVKFWSFEALKAEGWSVVHTRTLQLQEDALAVKLSPDGRLIAVSLMDSTIKVRVFESKRKSLQGVPWGPSRACVHIYHVK